jgi:hypothetical protein
MHMRQGELAHRERCRLNESRLCAVASSCDAICFLVVVFYMHQEAGMKVQRDFLLLVTFSMTAAAPAAAQTVATVPDISGAWNHTSLNGLELPLSGPGPLINRSRLRTGPQAGASDLARLVGDHTNPILQPWAADVVKKFGEISLAGKGRSLLEILAWRYCSGRTRSRSSTRSTINSARCA